METVAAFSFEERGQSYAARVGRPENIGVIGLVAFEELTTRPVPRLEKRPLAGAAPAEGYHSSKGVGGAGTGYGDTTYSPIYEVPFIRSGNRRDAVIYYDTAEALRQAGIPVDTYYPRPEPNPFPGDPKFVPPPPLVRD
jgi:hypothetical protein